MIAAIALSAQLQRTSLDLLDGLNVQIAAHNSAAHAIDVRFPQPIEYAIDIMHGSDVVWTSAPSTGDHAVALPPHTKRLLPGTTVLGIYVWNEETRDNLSPAPGDYVLRVRLLADGGASASMTRVRFIPPTPVSALDALRVGDAVTIAGRYDPAQLTIADATGTVKLNKKLLGAPLGATIAVRGYITAQADRTRVFSVSRWAPLAGT